MTNLLQIIENIVALLGPLQSLVSGVCFLIGFVMTIMALKQAQRRQEMGPGQGGWNAPIATFLTAAMFLSLPAFLNMMNLSLFGVTAVSASSIFTHAESTIGNIGSETARGLITGLVLIIQFMGVIAVCRGIFLMNQSAQGGQGPQTFGPGITFILCGVTATNFPIFVGFMEKLISS